MKQSRKQRVLQVMKDLELDAVLLSGRHNVRYLTGYCGDTGCAYVTADRLCVMTDFRYIFQAKAEAKDCEVFDIAEGGGSYDQLLARLAAEDGVKRLGFEGEELLFAQYARYEAALSGITLVSVSDRLKRLRAVKEAYEFDFLRRAEQIGDEVFTELLDFIKPGMTELAVAARLEYALKCHGAEGISFAPIVASGVHSSMPHAVPTEKKLEKGDFLTMDFGCIYRGYCSDMTRTIVIGKADERQRAIYDTVLRAQEAVLAQLKPGMTGKEIDAIARTLIDEAGYAGCFGHSLGHGTGLDIHEEPYASTRAIGTVDAGMTLTVEPGIYVQDYGGVRIEDMVGMTADGYENFTHATKALIEL